MVVFLIPKAQVEGIDKLTFDEDGRITELKVMLRKMIDKT